MQLTEEDKAKINFHLSQANFAGEYPKDWGTNAYSILLSIIARCETTFAKIGTSELELTEQKEILQNNTSTTTATKPTGTYTTVNTYGNKTYKTSRKKTTNKQFSSYIQEVGQLAKYLGLEQ